MDNWSFIPLGTSACQDTKHSLDLTQPRGKEAEIFTHQLLSVIGCRLLPGGINSLALLTCHEPVIGIWCGPRLPEKSLRQREIYAGKSQARRLGAVPAASNRTGVPLFTIFHSPVCFFVFKHFIGCFLPLVGFSFISLCFDF